LTTFWGLPILEGATFMTATLGATPTPSVPPAADDAQKYRVATSQIRYVFTRDLLADPLAFDPMKWATRIAEVSEIWDANSVDLSQFAAKGGKMILTAGLIDDQIPPGNAEDYYRRVVARFGQPMTDSFVRFYQIPGFGHGNGVFNARYDALGALDAWVDQGQPPQTLEAVDINPGNNGRRRPMCVYPAWPRYVGTGDPNVSSSFRCVTGSGE
jgi:feruloyl esterase